MIKNKSFKLALILSTSLLVSGVCAQDYTTVQQDPIGEEESLAKIAGKSIRVVPEGFGDEFKGNPANQREIKYTLAVEKAFEDQIQFKKKVIDSSTFEYVKSEETHEEDFYTSVHQAYDAQKWAITLTQGNPLRNISSQLFKASSNHLAKSGERGEWLPDNGDTKKVFTLIKNRKGQLSLLVQDLELALPVYSEHRVMPREDNNYAYAPQGKVFTNKQYNALLFLNRLLAEKPANRFKSGLLFLLQNPTEPFASLWDKLEGKNLKQLPSTINYDESYGLLKKVYIYHRGAGVAQLKEGNEVNLLDRALTRIKWGWNKLADTAPLAASWEEVVGKSWNFPNTPSQTLQNVNLQLIYVFEYHSGRGSTPYADFKDFEKTEVIRLARNIFLKEKQEGGKEGKREKLLPDTSELKTAIETFQKYPL